MPECASRVGFDLSVFTTLWDAVGWDSKLIRNVVEDACVFETVSLKRECSQFSVSFWIIAGSGLTAPQQRAPQSFNR